MKNKIQNIIGLILGLIIGSMVNMSIISVSDNLIPLPAGIDPEDVNSLRNNIHLFQPKNYVMPFLAHALGTLSGAYIAAKIATVKKNLFAYTVGVFFLIGGIFAANMIGTPLIPSAVDIIFAYIPMAWIALKLVRN